MFYAVVIVMRIGSLLFDISKSLVLAFHVRITIFYVLIFQLRFSSTQKSGDFEVVKRGTKPIGTAVDSRPTLNTENRYDSLRT